MRPMSYRHKAEGSLTSIEKTRLPLIVSFDDDAGIAQWIFVERRPGNLDVGAPEFRKLASHECVGLYKNGRPSRPIVTSRPCGDNRLQRHHPLYGDGGYGRRKMQQVDNRAPR